MAARGHHGAGADLEDLDDGRLLLGAEGGDRGCHGLGIGALVGGNHLVFALAFVEALDDFLELLTKLSAHGVPPGNLGGGESRRGGKKGQGGGNAGREAVELHVSLPIYHWRNDFAAGSIGGL